jgi:GT2 family glycosyltransferase
MTAAASSPSLSVSIVSYDPDPALLDETARTLAASLGAARDTGSTGATRVWLIDNGPDADSAAVARRAAATLQAVAPCEVVSGHGNVGYGAGHNFAIRASGATYHLVLNPDVRLDGDAIREAIGFMSARPEVILLAPHARDAEGRTLRLCKRYPSVLDLALRGFAPGFVKRAFDARLARYEMRDLPLDAPTTGNFIVSGSFMFLRREPVAAIGGFSDRFFLYFEDFDLSLRLARVGKIAFVPAVRIVHFGGEAARKGPRHVAMFASSGLKFFNAHGWKWA